MTVASEDKRTQFAGAGSAGPYTIGFTILLSSHLKVTRTVVSTGVDTIMTLDAGSDGFTIDAGLTEITLTEVLAAGERLTIERDVPLTQLIDYIANSAFPASVNEAGLDQLTMIAQQLTDAVERSAKFKSTLSDTLVASINETPVDTATLVWDGVTGDIINGPTTADIDAVAANAAAAASSATDAQTAQTAAELAETNAETAETNAAASAAEAAGSVGGVKVSADDTTPDLSLIHI